MDIFLEELLMLDRNTVQLMIDEMQDKINQQAEVLVSQEEEIGKNM